MKSLGWPPPGPLVHTHEPWAPPAQAARWLRVCSSNDPVHPHEEGRFARHADGHIERPA
jgi:hypothetical protein